MKTISRFVFGFVLVLLAAGCDRGERMKLTPPEFVIERPAKPEVIDHGDGTMTRVFSLPVDQLMKLAAASVKSDDPFAGEEVPEPPDDIGDLPLQLLKRFGVGFPEGTGAVYDREAETLTVRLGDDWIDYIEPLLDSVVSVEMGLSLRLEIYEVPTALALRLEQSACEHPEHAAEWEALQKVVEAGDARFITSCHLQTKSGEIGTVSESEMHRVFAGFEMSKDGDSPIPFFEDREVGTIAQFDAVLGPDDETIDFSLKLEHHTAPPDFSKVEIPVPGGSHTAVVELPAFHVKSIDTIITVLNGDTKLLCSWRPTGKPEFETKDVMRIVFLRADAHRISDGG